MGSTMPVVPRIEIPPTIPSFGLKVFSAISSPPGTLTITSSPVFSMFLSFKTSRRLSSIIFLGTEFIAASPIALSSPGLVTRPTPFPPSITIPGSSLILTLTSIYAPVVTSGSSPPSFMTEQVTFLPLSSRTILTTSA